jgi:phage terminase large subunit-like protein
MSRKSHNPPRPSISARWRKLFDILPGYDCVATADRGHWFDQAAADDVVGFFRDCLKHIEGALAGKPFVLEPWQQAIVGCLFGWKRADGTRRYRESLIFVPRKNGKTPLCAGIANYVLFRDAELGQQNVCAAAEREQASLLYRHVAGMIRQEPEMAKRCKMFEGLGQRSVQAEHGFFKAVSSDAHTKHGGNLHLCIVDELHAQPNRDLVDVLKTSMASANRRQPLMIYISTSDFERPGSICNEVYDYACKVRDRVIDDPVFLPVIYEISKDGDWKDPAEWARANPNLGVSVSSDYLKRECQRAMELPSYTNTFMRLHLNRRTQTDVRFFDMEAWDACSSPADGEGKPCYAGLDLSSTRDVTAFSLYWPHNHAVKTWFWVPKDNAEDRERKERVPYATWGRMGLIELTSGNVVDYDVIRARINEIRKAYDVREIAIDRWNSTQLQTQLVGDGLTVVPFGQGFGSMSSPTKELEKLVASRVLRHGGCPVLKWMASNTTAEQDAAGNLKPSKGKSTDKIDGIVALIMAIGRAIVQDVKVGVYESRGIARL